MQKAKPVFEDTNIKITTETQRHLGAVIGLKTFKQKYLQDKIDQWIKELLVLCKLSRCKPQAAYSGFIKGLKHKPISYMRIIPTSKANSKN